MKGVFVPTLEGTAVSLSYLKQVGPWRIDDEDGGEGVSAGGEGRGCAGGGLHVIRGRMEQQQQQQQQQREEGLRTSTVDHATPRGCCARASARDRGLPWGEEGEDGSARAAHAGGGVHLRRRRSTTAA